MTSHRLLARSLAAAVLLCGAAASQAAIVSLTSRAAFIAGKTVVSVDTFSDQTINTFLGVSSLTRAVGPFGYQVSSPDFYIAPAAGTVALSTVAESDALVFSSFTGLGPVYEFGGNFFATNILGEATTGAATGLTFVATDINGFSVTTTQLGDATSRFMGFRSDTALASVSVRMTTPQFSNSLFATADNITFVPEPSSLMLVLAAGFAMPLVRKRRGT